MCNDAGHDAEGGGEEQHEDGTTGEDNVGRVHDV